MSVDTRADAPARPRLSVGSSARVLLNTAIFAVILIVVAYPIGMLGIVSPLVWPIIVPLQAVVGGVTVMLFLTRVRRAGMFALFVAVVALFSLLAGNSWLGVTGTIVLGLIAELILWTGRYRSKRAAIWAYTIFALSFLTPFLPLLVDRAASLTSSSWTQMGDDSVNAADALLSVPVLGGVALAILAAGFLGALLGSTLLRRRFVRAGLA